MPFQRFLSFPKILKITSSIQSVDFLQSGIQRLVRYVGQLRTKCVRPVDPQTCFLYYLWWRDVGILTPLVRSKLRGALHQSLQHAQQCTPTCSSCSLPGARSPYLTLLSFKSSKKKLVSHHFVHTLAGCLLVAFSEKTCDVERQSRLEKS